MALGCVSIMAWNAIFIILSVKTSSLFHSFLKNNQLLFKAIVIMMNERENNIFQNSILMH